MSADGSCRVITATITRISSAGNGIINDGDSEKNIGPIKSNAIGKEVQARIINSGFAICLNRSVRGADYTENFWRISNIDIFLPSDTSKTIGERFDVSIIRSNSVGDPMAIAGSTQIHVPNAELRNTYCVELTENLYFHPKRFICPVAKIVQNAKQESEPDNDVKESQHSESGQTKPEPPTSEETQSFDSQDKNKNTTSPTHAPDNPKLYNLRKQAEEASNEVSTRSGPVTHQSKYTRSPVIKKYAKARADGFCEGCGKPAPFETSAGEPYLEVHHVHELAQGGEDCPDTVIALCPTCHTNVHYGRDGERLNDRFEQILDAGLAEVSTE